VVDTYLPFGDMFMPNGVSSFGRIIQPLVPS